MSSMYDGWLTFPPKDENAKIWRYMNLSKFISMLETKALFFSSIEELCRFDIHEGSITIKDKEIWDSNISYIREFDSTYEDYTNKKLESITRNKSLVFANCWCMSDYDSDLMWNKFTKNGYGLVIQSTVKRLKESVRSEYKVHVSMVEYSNEYSGIEEHFIRPYLRKLPQFKDEHELRAFISILPLDEPIFAELGLAWEKPDVGIFVDVDLDSLIEKIYVLSKSKNDFISEGKSILDILKMTRFSDKIEISDLGKPPIS